MAYAYYLNTQHRLVIIRPYGEFTDEQLIEVSHAFYSDPDREPGFDHLWDTRMIETLVMGVEVIDKYTTFQEEHEQQAGDGRVAVVATRETTETLATMLFTFGDEKTEQSQCIFNDMGAAAEWLDVPSPVVLGVHDDYRSGP